MMEKTREDQAADFSFVSVFLDHLLTVGSFYPALLSLPACCCCSQGTAYELQEIYGLENANNHGRPADSDDIGTECVICMSEPRDTTLLPCRHMCLCHECAQMLRTQTNKCPICRTQVKSLLEITLKS